MENKINYDEFKKVEMKVGKIISAEIVPDADKLLKLSVDFGLAEHLAQQDVLGAVEEVNKKDIRQIVSGIRAYFPEPEKLVGQKFMFVTNLEPRTIKGLESQGMILATGEGETFSIVRAGESTPEGNTAR